MLIIIVRYPIHFLSLCMCYFLLLLFMLLHVISYCYMFVVVFLLFYVQNYALLYHLSSCTHVHIVLCHMPFFEDL